MKRINGLTNKRINGSTGQPINPSNPSPFSVFSRCKTGIMGFSAEFIPYRETGSFSKIITDYLAGNPALRAFYEHPVSLQGIRDAIEVRKQHILDRELLAGELEKQYSNIECSAAVKKNIDGLRSANTFTVCTAHQPNIFTGHLYFIYKIIHTIRLADMLNREIQGHTFVPVFYVGSEDADLEELGEVSVNGEKYKWQTAQTGAVGRMTVDDELLKMLKKIKGQLSVEPYGKEVIESVQSCYIKGRTIQDACFCLVNKLFGERGLVVLLPDKAALKKQMQPVFEDDLFANTASAIVDKSTAALSEHYKVQANPREINLFYLQDGIRNRIIENRGKFRVYDTDIEFTKEGLQQELKQHPEKFSPNVILRALYQETILPNLVFVGGGGELAYWLELKAMFRHYRVPFPVLLLRNSFAIVSEKTQSLLQKLSLTSGDMFRSEADLVTGIVKRNSAHRLSLEPEKERAKALYGEMKSSVKEVDSTLVKHVEALLARLLKTLDKLEVKLLKAERKRFDVQQKQVRKIKADLFPNDSLQERVDNYMPCYAKWGPAFLDAVYENSKTLEQEFCILREQKD